MKLIYRGNTYEYNPSQSNNQGQALGAHRYQEPVQLTYRGATYNVGPSTQFAKATAPQTPYQLIYRGVTYSVDGSRQTQSTVDESTLALGKAIRLPNILNQPSLAKVHHANILRSLQHRIQVAKERGDQELIRLLESELRQVS